MNKLILNINDKETADDKKTAAYPRRRPRRLGRRRLQSGIFLKVFDIGLTAAGVDTDLFFHRPEPVSPNFVFFTGPSPVTMTMDGTTDAARYATWNASMLAVAHEDWPTTYKEITADLSNYEMAISGFDEYVTGRGLKSSTEVASISVIPTVLADQDKWFPRWPLGGSVPRTVKYTNTPSYAATGVSFTFDKNCDLFLVPSTMYGFGSSTYEPGPSFLPIYSHQYHFVQRVRSRNTLLGNADWENVWDNRLTPESIGAGGKALLVSYFVDDADGHTYRLRADHAGGSQTIDADNPVQLPGVDFPLVAERSDWRVSAELNVPHLDIIFGGLPSGLLIAVIRKHLGGGTYEWYFVWSSSTFGGVPFISNVEV